MKVVVVDFAVLNVKILVNGLGRVESSSEVGKSMSEPKAGWQNRSILWTVSPIKMPKVSLQS